MFDFNEQKTRTIFALNQCQLTAEQLTSFYKDKNDTDYKPLLDLELASFLNGLIIEKRGQKDGVEHQAEYVLTNNLIFNKLKIALALKADDVIVILASANLTLSKYELSAFFRNVNHKHYNECADNVLAAFLTGLQHKLQG